MNRMKKWFRTPFITALALIVAAGLILTSGIGAARASLKESAEYDAEVAMDHIGITLLENSGEVARRDYSGSGDGTWTGTPVGTILDDLPGDDGTLIFNKKYEEKLAVKNSGTIGEYVRVSIRRYWLDEDDKKVRALSPSLIKMSLGKDDLDDSAKMGSWVKDEAACTEERVVLYYPSVLPAGQTSPLFADAVSIDSAVAKEVTQEQTGNTIVTTYKYDGVRYCIEITADAVQENNAKDAVPSAWGRDAGILGQ